MSNNPTTKAYRRRVQRVASFIRWDHTGDPLGWARTKDPKADAALIIRAIDEAVWGCIQSAQMHREGAIREDEKARDLTELKKALLQPTLRAVS